MPKGETTRPSNKSLKKLAEMSGMKDEAAMLAKMMEASRKMGASAQEMEMRRKRREQQR